VGNVDHRFSIERRCPEDDGWTPEQPSLPQTSLQVDMAKSIISHNDSPDLPFEQSLNPYRGCEHGCIYCYARPTHAYLGLSPALISKHGSLPSRRLPESCAMNWHGRAIVARP
jgi:hypothetical protein